MGTDGQVSFAGQGPGGAYRQAGNNLGNLLFQYGLRNAIKEPIEMVSWNADPDRVRQDFKSIVIPSANQINPAMDLTSWADFLEAVRLPTLALGLGAQAKTLDDDEVHLKEGTLRYARLLSELSLSIGVRGEFSQKVLASFEIKNSFVSGCPSQLINRNISGSSIAKRLERISRGDIKSVRYLVGPGTPELNVVETHLAAIAQRYEHQYLYQSNIELIQGLFVNRADPKAKDLVDLRMRLRPNMSENDFAEYFLSTGEFYSSASSWVDSSRRHDLTVGPRIHGVVAAIMGGSLGLCVVFDSRTQELAESIGVPWVDVETALSSDSVRDLTSKAVFDPDDFDLKREENIGRMLEALSAADIYAA
jgi:hypothetical protein